MSRWCAGIGLGALLVACGPPSPGGGHGDGSTGTQSSGSGSSGSSTSSGTTGPAPRLDQGMPDVPPEPPTCGEMVRIPAGPFWMGCNPELDSRCEPDELPYHEVFLDAYEIDVCEVSEAEYDECVIAGACAENSTQFLTPCPAQKDEPANCIRWEDARDYCAWVGKRLPTEAEWEKAARGTDGRTYPWGEALPDCELAAFETPDVSCPGVVGPLMDVGQFPAGASPYGVLDMAGNVEEWVSDGYQADYYETSPMENPGGPQGSRPEYRILRGGSIRPQTLDQIYASFRVASRLPVVNYVDSYDVGFRCARDVE